MARLALLCVLLVCVLLRAAPLARAAATAGSIGTLSLPSASPGSAALRVYSDGGGSRVCYALSNPSDGTWAGPSGCVPTGLAVPTAPTCAALAAQAGGAAPPPPLLPPFPPPPSPPLPVRACARKRRLRKRRGVSCATAQFAHAV